ncbi:MAG: type III-A CRISPR-associated protein Csm2 [Desulfobulbaceae bacterium DB1]|nr:MAG: type III-A CRISPR-associated protein Csm2 [Desulfobulbaceae bacterium DB1]
MNDIIDAIKRKTSFSEVTVKEFAPAGKWAETVAKGMEKMKTAQLRKLFTSIKQIERKVQGRENAEAFDSPELYMLLPHLAYAHARKLVTPNFFDLMKTIIGDGGNNAKIKTVGDFRQFVQFMTAVVAYQKQFDTNKGN